MYNNIQTRRILDETINHLNKFADRPSFEIYHFLSLYTQLIYSFVNIFSPLGIPNFSKQGHMTPACIDHPGNTPLTPSVQPLLPATDGASRSSSYIRSAVAVQPSHTSSLSPAAPPLISSTSRKHRAREEDGSDVVEPIDSAATKRAKLSAVVKAEAEQSKLLEIKLLEALLPQKK